MTRYRATLAYDGTHYQGFQRQARGIPTIQGAVEQAIQTVTGQETTVLGAGRTDTGVHSRGQVIAFDVDWKHTDEALLKAINHHLPDDIALQTLCQHPNFHPRYDALSRTYRYCLHHAPIRQPLLNLRAWHIFGKLDRESMQTASRLLIGEHDFATFGQPPQGSTSTVREVYASHWEDSSANGDELFIYHVEATGFLYHMVRRIVGLLVQVGWGKYTVTEFETIFRQADVTALRVLAPAHGLTLEKVTYPERQIAE